MFKWLHRNKGQSKEVKAAVMTGVLMGEAQRPISQQEIIEQLGINIHIIEDDRLNALLEGMAVMRNKDGNVDEVDLDALALRVMASKLIRSSWVDPIDADIAQLEVERFINRVEMNMDEDTYEYGGTNLLEAVGKIIQTAWSDAKNGRKAKLLKVTPRVFEISMPEKKKGSVIS